MTERLPTDADLLDYDYLETCFRAEIAIYGRMSGETSFAPIDFYLGLMKQACEKALGATTMTASAAIEDEGRTGR